MLNWDQPGIIHKRLGNLRILGEMEFGLVLGESHSLQGLQELRIGLGIADLPVQLLQVAVGNRPGLHRGCIE